VEEHDDFQKRLAETIAKLKGSGLKVTEGKNGTYGFIGGVRLPRKKNPSELEPAKKNENSGDRAE
jgi:hypothetical protein